MGKLTDLTIKKHLKAWEKRAPYDVWDEAKPGFGVRVSGKHGAPVISFQVMRRVNGKLTRRVIGGYLETELEDGVFKELTLKRASDRADKWLAMMKAGIDPKAKAKEDRIAKVEAERQKFEAEAVEKQKREANNFKAAFDAYCAFKAKKKSTTSMRKRVTSECADWLDAENPKPLIDITAEDIKTKIQAIKARPRSHTGASAHLIFAYLRGFFNWIVDNKDYGLIDSPMAGLKPVSLIGEKNKGKRTFKEHEIAAFWRAASKMGSPHGDYFKFLLLTAVRRSQGAGPRWSEFKLDAEQPVWVIAGERTGTKDSIDVEVPLSPEAVALVERQPRRGDFVFSVRGTVPINQFGAEKRTLDALMRSELGEFKKWTLNDLRRTARTWFSKIRFDEETVKELGLPETIIGLGVDDTTKELLLGHKQKGLRGVYDQYDFFDEKAAALKLWARQLLKLVEP